MSDTEPVETPPEVPVVTMNLLLPLSHDLMVRITSAFIADQMRTYQAGKKPETDDIEKWMGNRVTELFGYWVDQMIRHVTGTSPQEARRARPSERPSSLYTRITAEAEEVVAKLFADLTPKRED